MRLDSTVVALTSCSEYTAGILAHGFDQVLGVLDQMPELHSSTVLLKPNLITTRHGLLACTEPAFILAAARWFVDHGARVTVGDSPSFGSAAKALQVLGIAGELNALGVTVADFTRGRMVSMAGGGRVLLAADAVECDLLVNLPRVKAHSQTRVTLAVKNYFGCVVGLRKPWWHMAYGGKNGDFSDRLVQLLQLTANSITLVDGITAMHKTGPVHGEPYPLALVGASANPVAMDRALHKVLNLDSLQSPLLQACRRAGLIGTELSQLTFPLAAPSDIQVDDFQTPLELSPIRFNPFRFLKSSVERILLKLEQAG
jgi:uncharacterized protein (DUF362 family)